MLKVLSVTSMEEMQDLLQGTLVGGSTGAGAGRLYDLHGKTLVFTAPAATVTLSDPTAAGLRLQDIVAQVNAATAALTASLRRDSLAFTAVSGGITLAKTGTANSALRFSSATASAALRYNPPSGAAPRLVETNNKSTLDGYYVIVEV